jgi:hypothetical protein
MAVFITTTTIIIAVSAAAAAVQAWVLMGSWWVDMLCLCACLVTIAILVSIFNFCCLSRLLVKMCVQFVKSPFIRNWNLLDVECVMVDFIVHVGTSGRLGTLFILPSENSCTTVSTVWRLKILKTSRNDETLVQPHKSSYTSEVEKKVIRLPLLCNKG